MLDVLKRHELHTEFDRSLYVISAQNTDTGSRMRGRTDRQMDKWSL